MQFEISSRSENKEIPESSKLDFLEKFSANKFALSDAEDNNSRQKVLLAICQKSRKPRFWELIILF